MKKLYLFVGGSMHGIERELSEHDTEVIIPSEGQPRKFERYTKRRYTGGQFGPDGEECFGLYHSDYDYEDVRELFSLHLGHHNIDEV